VRRCDQEPKPKKFAMTHLQIYPRGVSGARIRHR
jgi:hypothetical protein